MARILKTNISQAYWHHTNMDHFQPAAIHSISNRDIAWLDRLLEGGIALPEPPSEGEDRAITLLITGPPGSGKSTLALELCYRCALDKSIADKGLSSLYITSETDEEWIQEKAKSFGWEHADRVFIRNKSIKVPIPTTSIWNTSDFQSFLECRNALSESLRTIIACLAPGAKNEIGKSAEEAQAILDRRNLLQKIDLQEPDIVIIDSLNTIEKSQRPELFRRFSSLISCGAKIMIFILESDSRLSSGEFWEYAADIVLRLDRRYISDYMVRTIEILKARHQAHIWGIHQLKIYPPFKPNDNTAESLHRAHPYRKEGGIFIYPSIHYYLSVYKRMAPESRPTFTKTPLATLNQILGKGFPRGRCTGFIGCRGGHKSHLGYLHILTRILQSIDEGSEERGIIISLRDDEGMARKTLGKILKDELSYPGDLENLEQEGRLEILYYPPGYITPEEFFHRLLINVHRLKGLSENSELHLLFNSLDQLSSRFPLCARQQIFIPGIIEMLSAENVSSIFVAVEEPGQPPEQYGLLSMADALISFEQRKFEREDYCGHLNEYLLNQFDHPHEQDGKIEDCFGRFPRAVSLRVVRFAGGQAAGAGGILELIERGSPEIEFFREKSGLHFIPFSAKHLEGEVDYEPS